MDNEEIEKLYKLVLEDELILSLRKEIKWIYDALAVPSIMDGKIAFRNEELINRVHYLNSQIREREKYLFKNSERQFLP